MRRGGWVIPAFVAVAVLCGANAARAQLDSEPEDVEETASEVAEEASKSSPEAAEEHDAEPKVAAEATAARFLYFTGADIWRNGYFSHGGFLFAPQGLGESGFVFKLLLNGGLYRYRSAGTEITGRQMMASILPGWRFRREGLEVTIFGGLDVQDHRFSPNDPNRLRGTHAGVRAGFDVWYEPFRDAMVTGSASLSTVGSSYWTRAAAGLRLFESIWVGPEFIACGDLTYRQLRAGAHITSLRFREYEFSAGAGWVTDTDRRDGFYGRIGMLMRR